MILVTGMKFDRCNIWCKWHMTYDITKHSPKKPVLLKYHFFLWNAILIIYKENFFFVIISEKKSSLHSSEKLDVKNLYIKLFFLISSK